MINWEEWSKEEEVTVGHELMGCCLIFSYYLYLIDLNNISCKLLFQILDLVASKQAFKFYILYYPRLVVKLNSNTFTFPVLTCSLKLKALISTQDYAYVYILLLPWTCLFLLQYTQLLSAARLPVFLSQNNYYASKTQWYSPMNRSCLQL